MKIVKIISYTPAEVKQKKAGGTYACAVLRCNEFDRETGSYNPTTKEVTVMHNALQTNSPLHEALEGCQAGEVYELHYVKNGLYSNLNAMRKTDSTSTPSTSSTPSPSTTTSYGTKRNSDDYAIGQQVGNALNVAAALLAAKVMKGDLESAAHEVITIGERLKTAIKTGTVGTTTTTTGTDE